MEDNNKYKNLSKGEKYSGQIAIKCKLDEFMNLAEDLLKNHGFEMELIPTDTWPIVIDFDKKVAYTINSATNSYLTKKAHNGFMSYKECIEYLRNYK